MPNIIVKKADTDKEKDLSTLQQKEKSYAPCYIVFQHTSSLGGVMPIYTKSFSKVKKEYCPLILSI